MKKITCLLLICVLIITTLSGCSQKDAAVDDSGSITVGNFAPDTNNLSNLPSDSPTMPSIADVPLATTDAPVSDPFSDIGSTTTDEPATNPFAITNSTNAGTPAPNPFATSTSTTTDAPPFELFTVPESNVNASSYRYDTLTDTSFGFTLAYPAHWENLPGKSTVCFREVVEDGDVPARVAVTKKTLVHTPRKSETIIAEFQSYANLVCAQYDAKTLQFSELSTNDDFMGKDAYSITYLAYDGDVEVQGYMVICAIDKTLYVFHFSASYADYIALESVMERIRDSVKLS